MKSNVKKKFGICAVDILLAQVLFSVISPLIAMADINHPEQVSVEYSDQAYYGFESKHADGSSFSHISASLYAVSGSNRAELLCIEPGILIYRPSSPSYTKNPLPAMSERAKLISALWDLAGKNDETQMVAQAMIWEEYNGITSNRVYNRMNGKEVDVAGIKGQINKIITDYKKQPSFNNQTLNITQGQSVIITDTNAANIGTFDRLVENSANVDYTINGNQLTIIPKGGSKASGTLKFEKTLKKGTPVAYKKSGEQTVMAGAIDQTNQFEVKINVELDDNLKIVKRDKESGALVPGTVFSLDFHGVRPNTEVTTGADGTATLLGIPHGAKVTITEKSVPAPYVIDPAPMEAVIKAGETIEVTSRNLRAKGQIMVDKTGHETETDLWNEHYTLAGNVFDIRKDSANGDQ